MDEEIDTQWTPEALTKYRIAATALSAALQDHVEVVAARTGRKREWRKYRKSAQVLGESLDAFAEAEFDWCGTYPFAMELPEEDEFEDEDESFPSGNIVSILGRWDFVVHDENALRAAGQRSREAMWEDDAADPESGASELSPSEALYEVIHQRYTPLFTAVPGIAPVQDSVVLINSDKIPDLDDPPPFGPY